MSAISCRSEGDFNEELSRLGPECSGRKLWSIERKSHIMALLVLASGLYRLMARRMRGYGDAQARQIFRDLIDTPADIAVAESEITLRFHRRAHLPIVLASGLFDKPVAVPWWNNRPLRLIQ
jgi:hypothetical protein